MNDRAGQRGKRFAMWMTISTTLGLLSMYLGYYISLRASHELVHYENLNGHEIGLKRFSPLDYLTAEDSDAAMRADRERLQWHLRATAPLRMLEAWCHALTD